MKAYCFVIFMLLIGTSGCTAIKYAKDNYPYQPIVKPPHSVEGLFVQKPYGPVDFGKVEMLYTDLINWKGSGSKTYNSEDVIWECDSYLAKNKILTWRYSSCENCPIRDRIQPECEELSEDELPDDDRYPWLRYQNAFYLKPNSLTEREVYERAVRNAGHRVIKTIICLKPLVAIISEGTILNYYESKFIDFENTAVMPDWPGVDIRDADGILLKHGYAYGTRIPYSEKLEWFSPELNILPKPVDIDQSGVGHIKVKWGELVFTKVEDEWVVSAQAAP